MDRSMPRRRWIRIAAFASLLGLSACSPPGGSDEATVVPDPNAAVKALPIADGKAEIPAPAPPSEAAEQP